MVNSNKSTLRQRPRGKLPIRREQRERGKHLFIVRSHINVQIMNGLHITVVYIYDILMDIGI